MPRFLVWAFGAVGSAILARVVTRLVRRVERELNEQRMSEAVVKERLPRLRLDPKTGVWRPE
jgi:hypothetical protein